MKLNTQKRIAAYALGCSRKRVIFDESRLSDIKEAITKVDIRSLVNEGAIKEKPVKGTSRVKARKRAIQRSKGRQRGFGKRKGKKTSRLSRKRAWIGRIRIQRGFIKILKEKKIITTDVYRQLYLKTKGGFFRSKRHIKIYLDEHKLVKGIK